jgi:hypothetical protein
MATNTPDSFIILPMVGTSAYVSNLTTGTTVTPTSVTSPWASTGLKGGYWNLVHSADILSNGVQLEQSQQFTNAYVNFKMLSQMSQDDLNSFGTTLGLGEKLDNVQSMRFNGSGNMSLGGGTLGAYPSNLLSGTSGLQGGNGLGNNSPFPSPIFACTQLVTTAQGAAGFTLTMTNTTGISVGQLVYGLDITQGTTVVAISTNASINLSLTTTAAVPAATPMYFYNIPPANAGDQSSQGLQTSGCVNNGYYSRLKKFADVTNGSLQNIYGTSSTTAILSSSEINVELKPSFQISGNYMIWYDYAVIRLCDLFDSMKNMPITKRLDATIRLYINVGAVASEISSTGAMLTSGSTNSFVNTCPLIQSCLPFVPSGAIGIVSSLGISKSAPSNFFGGVNLSLASGSSPLTSCRIYFSKVKLHPERAIEYFSKNKSKRVCYTSFYSNQYTAISSGSTFNQLVQSGVRRVRGVLIIPYLSSTTNGSVASSVATSTTTFSQWQSPFDTAPATSSPISLTNLNVYIGNQAVLKTAYNIYSYENFLEQVSLCEKINSADLGLSNGLINQYFWENSRFYYVDCTRADPSDQLANRNVVITFQNNSLQVIDVLVYTEYWNSVIVDCETGLMTKE